MMIPIMVTIEMTLISMAIIITEVGGLITVVDGEMITITITMMMNSKSRTAQKDQNAKHANRYRVAKTSKIIKK